MSSITTNEIVRDPGNYTTSSRTKMIFWGMAALGVIAFLGGLRVNPVRAWSVFVQNHFYFMCLSLGGLFFAALHWLTGAMWSTPVRRLAESFTSYLPVVLVTFAILCVGMPHIYIWTQASHVQGDLVLEHKAGYLNPTFFIIRNVIAILIWLFFAYKMIGNSIKQDTTKAFSLTGKNAFMAPVFMIFFALSFTMVSFDQIMSLDPHWFSTIFGIYCFAGLYYLILASTCLMTVFFHSNGKLAGIVNENHFQDLGKFMFGITVFWAYIGFSQFMLIWYANLPEETGYYLHRFHGGWARVSLFLLVGKFMLPFIVLLPRGIKRNKTVLAGVGIYMLIAQWVDILWMVQPEFFPDGPRIGLIEIGVTIGFVGVMGLCVSRFLERNKIIPIGDPRLTESVFHFHQ